MFRPRTVFILLGMVVLMCSGALLASAQQTNSLPPHVIDVWPLPGVELASGDGLTITFDQAMDRASVEGAFGLEPGLSGAFTWADDRTVTFTPDGGWPRARTFAATVGIGAAADNGLTLEEAYTFEVVTVGALEVTSVTPEDGAEGVAADARLVVTFNRPVVPLVSTEQMADLPAPLVIDPPLEGQGEWINTSIYAFTPAGTLNGGTTYTLKVAAGLTTVTGAVLEQDYVWSFRTLAPQILYTNPGPNEGNVLLDRAVSVTFSQPMDRTSTQDAFFLLHGGEPVAGQFEWNSDSTVLTFRPDRPLAIDSVYIVNLTTGARSAGGDASLTQGQSFGFSTVPLPAVARSYPGNGERDVRPGSGASLEFRSPMNTETFEGRIVISPEPEEWQPVVWGEQSLSLQFSSLPNTTYTITLLAGSQDIYGNPITTDYTFGYSTGDIRTYAYSLARNYELSLIGAHRENSRLPIYISGTPTVGFELYRVDPAYVRDFTYGYYYDTNLPRFVHPENLVRAWTESFDSQGREGVAKEVLLASEQGGQLPTGIYWVVMRAPDDQRYQFPLAVVTANVTLKRSPGEVMVWVTDMPSANPVAGATVTVYHHGEALLRGSTDDQGVFRSTLDLSGYDDRFIHAVVEGPGVYGVWYSTYASDLPRTNGYLYTDRPIYRPGETVYFRGVLRDRLDMDYSVPNVRSVRVTMNAMYSGQLLFDEDVPVTEYGTFSGELVLAEDAPVDQVTISAGAAYVSFTIAEFRVPEFEVSVTPQVAEMFQGETLNAVVQSSFYSGGAVSNASLSWYAYGSPTSFAYTGPGRYTFLDSSQEYFYHELGSGSGTTDASGRFMITSENTRPPYRRPMAITIEASVTDESMQQISGRASLIAHPANVYVGLRSDRYFGREGQPMEIGLIAVTAASEPLADKRINLELVEIRWTRIPVEGQFGRYTWERQEIEVETGEVRTGADGTATYTFTPSAAGIYRVRAEALDEYERPNSSTLQFWVTGNRPVWWGEPSQTIDLIADKDSYRPGDVAQVLVPIPFAGASTVLVSVERAGIISYEVLAVEGSTLLYELPLTEAHVPTVHLDVTVVKGIDEESLNPDYRTGQITLNVEPVEQQLVVTLTPTARLAQPRDSVTFDMQVTDAHGEPVVAEVGVALTDKAILALMAPNSGSLIDQFYGSQGDYVSTDISLTALLDRITDEYVSEEQERAAGGAMEMADGMVAMAPMMAAVPTATAAATNVPGQAQTPVTVRENFEQTPLWAAHVITGADGRASVSVDLPDNLTTWTLDARALTLTTEVGQATTEIVSTLPLLIRPVTPRFFVVDDRVQLAAVVNNNTESAQTVQVSLDAGGVTLESDATQTVTIEAGGRARVEWMAVAQDVQFVDLTFIAIGPDGYQDASKPTLATGPNNTIPVYRYTAPDRVGTGGVLREGGSRVEAISLPPRLDASQGDLTVRVDPSLAVTTVDALDYLRNYPHQCIEQTVSRFLPNVVTYSALRDLGLSDPDLEAKLYTALTEAVAKLTAEQNPDGGWGWFGAMESDPLVTAYASLGLIEARAAGFEIDSGMIDRGLNFVRRDTITPRMETQPWRLNRQAFYFYVLAQAGQGNLDEFQALFEQRLEMSFQARAYLLMAYQTLFPEQSAVADLVSDLTSAAILSATGAHWEEAGHDWWNWSSNTRTTAVVLGALIKAVPQSDLLPNAVRWLMVARQGDHWESTQETAWAVMALTDWMVLTGELRGNYDYQVALNQSVLGGDTVTPETVREGQVLRVAVSDLLRDEINQLVVVRGEGEGALYYTAHLNLRLPASEVDALSRGISVSREYFLADDPETAISSAQVGDVITVRLTLNLPQAIYYFVLEDPIPAGTEGVNTSLLTTSRRVEGPMLERQWDYDPFWYWGWWWFDHTEMRDEQVNLYADYLPRGTYVYTYQIRASVPGEFQTMPSQAYAFYFPEVFGRTAGTLFTVQPADGE